MTDTQLPPIKQSPSLQIHARKPSFADSQDGSLPSPMHSRKRSADQMADGHATRKGRACLACRKLKVKCDSLERGDSGCSRCQRLGLECITTKRQRVSLEDAEGREHPSLVRLEKAMEEVLGRLKMPSLESYSHTPNLISESVAQTTRENSREPPPQVEQDIASAPMEGLFEATQLNTLRARLKHGDPTAKNARRRMESDLVSQGLITLEEAEDMFHLFKTTLSRYLFDATIREDRTLQSVRESSTLFFTAIMVVASLHIPDKEKIHILCHKQLRDLVASSMFDRTHTLEDIRGLCIAAFWLPDLSWKLSGHCVRMATELNLHQAFYKAFYSPKLTSSERSLALERARLWYLLYVLDHHFSIAYGRPPVISEMQAIKETNLFLSSPECTSSDRRVISQVTLFVILSRAYAEFGLEAERLMGDDDQTLIAHARFIEDLNRWRQNFRLTLKIDAHVGDYPAIGVDLHFHFANMMLNSLSLRGRSLPSLSHLPTPLRPLALRALESAHRILAIVLEEPDIQRSLVGVPLYLHSVIAFAVVFLIKMSSRWKSIGVTIDPEMKTRPMIENVITKLKECEAGKGHILYNMASGFERLLRRNISNGANGNQHMYQHSAPTSASITTASGYRQLAKSFHQGGLPQQQQHVEASGRHYSTPNPTLPQPGQEYLHSPTPSGASGFPAQLQRTSSGAYDQQKQPQQQQQQQQQQYGISPSSASGATFGGWQTEDDMIWSMGMGYDLLNNQPDLSGMVFGSGVEGLYGPAGMQ